MSAGLYRYRAQECTSNAEQAVAAGERAKWLELEGKWLRLADEVEGRQLKSWGVSEAPRGRDAPCSQELSFSARILCQH
jgi:hypothetical protein